jgi:hypothetical protein
VEQRRKNGIFPASFCGFTALPRFLAALFAAGCFLNRAACTSFSAELFMFQISISHPFVENENSTSQQRQRLSRSFSLRTISFLGLHPLAPLCNFSTRRKAMRFTLTSRVKVRARVAEFKFSI